MVGYYQRFQSIKKGGMNEYTGKKKPLKIKQKGDRTMSKGTNVKETCKPLVNYHRQVSAEIMAKNFSSTDEGTKVTLVNPKTGIAAELIKSILAANYNQKLSRIIGYYIHKSEYRELLAAMGLTPEDCIGEGIARILQYKTEYDMQNFKSQITYHCKRELRDKSIVAGFLLRKKGGEGEGHIRTYWNSGYHWIDVEYIGEESFFRNLANTNPNYRDKGFEEEALNRINTLYLLDHYTMEEKEQKIVLNFLNSEEEKLFAVEGNRIGKRTTLASKIKNFLFSKEEIDILMRDYDYTPRKRESLQEKRTEGYSVEEYSDVGIYYQGIFAQDVKRMDIPPKKLTGEPANSPVKTWGREELTEYQEYMQNFASTGARIQGQEKDDSKEFWSRLQETFTKKELTKFPVDKDYKSQEIPVEYAKGEGKKLGKYQRDNQADSHNYQSFFCYKPIRQNGNTVGMILQGKKSYPLVQEEIKQVSSEILVTKEREKEFKQVERIIPAMMIPAKVKAITIDYKTLQAIAFKDAVKIGYYLDI